MAKIKIKIKIKWIFILIALPVLAYFTYKNWHEGTPYGEKQYSPNKEFYYQRYKVFTIEEWIPYVPMPGGGSDSLFYVDGYVRGYTANGDFIGEAYAHGMPMANIFWIYDFLVVMDGASNNDDDGRIKFPKDVGFP
ncbi:hypothetical protein QN379_08585 [Glaciimonas sp. Gout2]|uniref:hypothetical protein n=1 Tax=unclassified Glaciimonas TaxID=2644401 RepID=UPI002AB496A3|nr:MULTISPECIES: hypothetical protein [unclassified Glaciimonas]MDY7546258.1 hypothetical protein [Glaciimonas sp. CA11.2]MEB0010793.1 hypothetical protein [Glaciimonas sp. Cout2]MEB0082071.1 hypothetical protein [Glaciimonas sp. Gout2]